ncbi:MAG: DNA polymerase III subunit gamma/tau [Dysgonamonadaceae bacterium]|jgi:DNA polymerase-3 subunit gamma/tau|nr:DNA polymerase III subunit gamma/tau [Dysgonamonadaceae bacterium]
MDNYIVSARKYRPATFQSVVGQKSLTTTLKNAIHNHKLAHAYLFCGPRGVGKTTCARIFAKTINCLHPTPEGEACNACESCMSFNEQRSYNIHELDAASNNSVEDIRSLIEQVRIPPQLGKYKVYIIDEVHMLSSAAFNAFLKTLEEPPHHAIFILATTEKHKILPTILSRCQIYDFNRIGINDTVEHLQYVAQQEGVSAEPEALNVIAQKADGGMRDALSIFDQVVSFTGGNISYRSVIENLNVLDYEYYFQLTDNILQGNIGKCFLILNEILSKGFEGQNIVGGLASHFRDLMVCKDPQTIVLFEVGDVIKKRYLELAVRCENPFLYKALEYTNECDLNYRLSKNKRLLVEILLIRLCQLNSSPSSMGDDKKKIAIEPLTAHVASPEKSPEVKQYTENQQQATIASQPAAQKETPPAKAINERLSFSLKDLYEDKKEPVQTQQAPAALESQTNDFTQQELNAAWTAYANQFLKEEQHLQNSMLNSLPRMTDKYAFEVSVYNPEQQQKLTERAPTLLEYLRSQLHNTAISMHISIDESAKDKIFMSDRDRYIQMAEKNPSLHSLANEFGLTLD